MTHRQTPSIDKPIQLWANLESVNYMLNLHLYCIFMLRYNKSLRQAFGFCLVTDDGTVALRQICEAKEDQRDKQ